MFLFLRQLDFFLNMVKSLKVMGNKYTHLSTPQATLDFHGKGILTAEEICSEAESFVKNSFQKGLRKILIITGKGLHSNEGPVIFPMLKQFLPSLPLVQSVMTARRDRGGEGALEVELV